MRIGLLTVRTGTHRPGLDGVRAWAVCAVVAFHSGVLRAGWIGVDVFMALSGYLITRVIVVELQSPRGFRLRRFWMRRARRLLPGLLLLLVVVTLVTLWAPGGWPPPTRSETFGALTYTSNWVRIAASKNYWTMFSAPSPLDHLWSLAIEEQFYVVWPIVVLIAWRAGGQRALQRAALVGAVLLGVWQVVVATTSASVERIYVGTDTRAPSFLLGAAACAFLLRRNWNADRARVVLAAAACALVAACIVLDGRSIDTYRGPLLGIGLLGATVAASAAQLDGSRWFDLVFTAAPLRAVGRWSYGIYLFHWPLLVLVRELGWSPVARFVVVAIASTALAAASYEWYERPIREGRLTIRWMPFAAAAVAAAAITALAVAVVPRPQIDAASEARLRTRLPSAPEPSTSVVNLAVATLQPADTGGDRLLATTATGTAGTVAAAATVRRVLVVGDSVAFGLTQQLVAAGADNGDEVAVRAAPGCTMSTERADQNNLFSQDLCIFIRGNLRQDVVDFRPDHTLLLFGGTWSPLRSGGRDLDPCSPAGRQALLDNGRSLLDDLSFAGGDVVIAIPPRMAGEYVSAGAAAAPCYAAGFASLAAERPDRVSVIRLDRQVCAVDELSCPRYVDGVELRYDGLHFGDAGGAIVSHWLIDQVAAARSATERSSNRRLL